MSPNQRAWARFRRNRIGTWSLWIFVALLVVSALAEVLSNDAPLVAYYDGSGRSRCSTTRETAYAGDFGTPTEWTDPFIEKQFARHPGSGVLRTLNPHAVTPATVWAHASTTVDFERALPQSYAWTLTPRRCSGLRPPTSTSSFRFNPTWRTT